MNAFFTYVFKHKHYKDVIASYNEAVTNYSGAYRIWAEHRGFQIADSFEDKCIVAAALSKIKDVDSWIKKYYKIQHKYQDGILWFFIRKRRLSAIPELHYDEYNLIFTNIEYIKTRQGYYNTYKKLIASMKDAVDLFIGNPKSSHSYDEIKKIVKGESQIIAINKTLSLAHKCESTYSRAWKLFAYGREFKDIPLSELETIKEDDFTTKNTFLRIYYKNASLVNLILGDRQRPIESFDTETIEVEEEFIIFWSVNSGEQESIKPLNVTVHIEDEKKLKRAILDSTGYGIRCNFTDSYTIGNFYKLRSDFDKIDVAFDDALNATKREDAAIRAYNKANSNKDVVYIEDYLQLMTEGSPLNIFVENYRQEQEKRNKARDLKRNYSKGFNCLFPDVDIDVCLLNKVVDIIEAESRIKAKDSELEEIERRRREAERQRHEAERKQREIRTLKECVSSWSQPNRASVNCFSLYNYYPTTCDWNASEREWDIRNLVWDFKANPNRPQSLTEITTRHKRAMNEIMPDIKRVLRRYFGSDVSKLTLVCIPSSKKVVNERRYKDFAQQLCSDLNMSNGYSYVNVVSDGETSHLGGSSSSEISIDNSYFNGRYVILFDDVITSGRSMERLKRAIETAGGTVIAGLSIGKTRHERQSSHPINTI